MKGMMKLCVLGKLTFSALALCVTGAAIAQEKEPPAAPAPRQQALEPKVPADASADEAEPEQKELPPPAPGPKPAPEKVPAAPPPKAVPPSNAPATEKPPAPPANVPPPGAKPMPPKPPAAAQPVAPATLEERRIAQISDRIRQELPKRTPPLNVKIVGGAISKRILTPGSDLVLVAEGGALRDRVELYGVTRAALEADAYWKEWLKTNNVSIIYNDPPFNASDVVVPVTATTDEIAQINQLLALLNDEIALDVDLHGAYVESAEFYKPVGGPGRVLRINGRIIDEAQRPLLAAALEHAAASIDAITPWRGNVFFSLESVVVGPLERERSNRYYTMALEAFWHCDFARSRDTIVRALADDPTSVVLQYWRVLVHIAMGEEDAARRKLVPLLAADPWGSNGVVVATALERMQGPLRWRLRELEQDVLLTMLP